MREKKNLSKTLRHVRFTKEQEKKIQIIAEFFDMSSLDIIRMAVEDYRNDLRLEAIEKLLEEGNESTIRFWQKVAGR